MKEQENKKNYKIIKAKEQRRSDALRANLRKRKDQVRLRNSNTIEVNTLVSQNSSTQECVIIKPHISPLNSAHEDQ